MDLDLTGKLALVTGSTRGIGLASAIGLAQMGAEVIVNGREAASIKGAIAKIKQSSPSANLHAAVLDLAGTEGCGERPRNSRRRHPRQQPRNLRAEAVLRHRGRRLDENVRGQRHERRPPDPALPETHVGSQAVGPRRVRLHEFAIYVPKEMVHYGFSRPRSFTSRAAPPSRPGQPTSPSIRSCPARPGSRWRRSVLPRAPREWEPRSMISSRAPSANAGRRRCCSATRRRRKWLT